MLFSPVNTKLSCSPPVLDGAAVAEYPVMPDGRTKDQGTATSFSLALLDKVEDVVEEAEGVADGVDGVVGVVADADGAVLLALGSVPLVADELRENTAKSILPEAGLMMTSSSLPSSSPVELLIEELLSWLARTSC